MGASCSDKVHMVIQSLELWEHQRLLFLADNFFNDLLCCADGACLVLDGMKQYMA